MAKKFLDRLTRVGANSDFMVLNAWTSILRNFRIGFSCRISVNPNNQTVKLTVNIIRHNIDIHASRIIKSLLARVFLFYKILTKFSFNI